MAESTLMITGGGRCERNPLKSFHGSRLDSGQVLPVPTVDPYARQLVSCGRLPVPGQIVIVDPDRREQCPPGTIGEIWVASQSVGRGYLNKPQETEETFRATLHGDDEHRYLRTGDLGFFHDDRLFVTGRIKDLIIIRGVNRYPQDIEQTVVHADTRLRTGAAAAFAVDMHGRDQLIIVCEVERIAENNWDEVIGAIRRSVTATHELPPDGIILIRAGSIPKTSSGKIQRHACRAGFLNDSLMVVAEWLAWRTRQNGNAANSPGNPLAKHNPNLLPIPTAVPRDSEYSATPHLLSMVFDAVRRVAQDRAGELSETTNIVELGLDSLERLEIANAIEDALGGSFPDEVLRDMETCGEVARAAAAHLGQAVTRKRPRKPIESSVEDFPEYKALQRNMLVMLSSGIANPYFRVHESVTNDTTLIAGRRFVNFSSYNYLGMSGDPAVSEAAAKAARDYGTSCSASRLVSGEKPIHRQLERTLADFLGVEDAIVFVGGHATNETTIRSPAVVPAI